MAPAAPRRLSSDIPGGVPRMFSDISPESSGQVFPTLSTYQTGENSASSFREPWFEPSFDATARYPHFVAQSQARYQQTISARAVYQSADAEDIMPSIRDEVAYTDDQGVTSCCDAHMFSCLPDYSNFFATTNAQQHCCSSSPSYNHPTGFRYNVVTRSPTGGQTADNLTPSSSSVGIKCNEYSNNSRTSYLCDVSCQPLTQSHDFQNPQGEQLSGEYCQQLSQSLEDAMVFCSPVDLNVVNDSTHREDWTPYFPPSRPSYVDLHQEEAVGFAAEAHDLSSVAIYSQNIENNYTRSSSRRPSVVSTSSIESQSFLADQGPGNHSESSKSTALTNRTTTSTTATRLSRSGKTMNGVPGGVSTDGVANYCQNNCCGASLTHEKAYCQRYRLCKHCIGKLSLILNGEAKRFCQQCSLLHPIGEFDKDKKSCRKKLEMHALRLRQRRAAKRLLDKNSGS